MRKSEPQLSPDKYIPLLQLDTIAKGTHIHKPNDLSQFHWQFTTYIITGIDNDKGVLLCKDLDGKVAVVPFSDLSEYYVLKYYKGKRKKVKRSEKLTESSWVKK